MAKKKYRPEAFLLEKSREALDRDGGGWECNLDTLLRGRETWTIN